MFRPHELRGCVKFAPVVACITIQVAANILLLLPLTDVSVNGRVHATQIVSVGNGHIYNTLPNCLLVWCVSVWILGGSRLGP